MKSSRLKVEVLPHGNYRINPLDLIELSLTATERAEATPKNRRLRYDELHDKMIHVTFELEDMEHRLTQAERKTEQLTKRRSPAAPAKKAPTSAKKKRSTRSRTTLPRDVCHCALVCTVTRFPPSTVAKAMRDECLWVERGSWKVRGVVVKEALDYVGMKRFYELYDDHSRFVSCDECPHCGCVW